MGEKVKLKRMEVLMSGNEIIRSPYACDDYFFYIKLSFMALARKFERMGFAFEAMQARAAASTWGEVPSGYMMGM